MNLNETLRIMAVIRSEYPSFGGRDLSGGDLDRSEERRVGKECM